MTRLKLLCVYSAILFSCCSTLAQDQTFTQLIGRVTNHQGSLPISTQVCPAQDGATYYSYHAKGGKLYLKGNSINSICRGFYDYMKSHHHGLYSWDGSTMTLPNRIPDETTTQVVSPFKYHNYLNVVTFGYTTPYWGWERWEREIDWMALHGIDMPLALNAYEAIIARVWRKMGLDDKTINAYFSGPAHLPWMRMGNLDKLDGPLNADWHRQQLDLQHRILDRMKMLGMTPICPGFAGFIPEEFKKLYPNLKMSETHWGGAFTNHMIAPDQPLFKEMSTAFIKEWEKEFGKQKYYLVDSFNELDLPFGEQGDPKRYQTLQSYGKKVYECIAQANPDATWVMQGWMFGATRDIWDYQSVEALLKDIPDDKIILLDLAVNFHEPVWHSEVNWEVYKGFFNKQWIYSIIPNMGGKSTLTGNFDFYAHAHKRALNSENRGNLIGFGTAPEGIENNEAGFELLYDASWTSCDINLDQWTKDYSINRYGSCPTPIQHCWSQLRKSVYGSTMHHPRYNWQYRPWTVKKGTVDFNSAFFDGVEHFVTVADTMQHNALYRADLAEFSALYLGAKAEWLLRGMQRLEATGDSTQSARYEEEFLQILTDMDRILTTHPTLRLERWIDLAHKQAANAQQKTQYETEAKRIVTIWGPPYNDYACRVWSGLIRDYYRSRWAHYFASRRGGRPFDLDTWEREWVERSHGCSAVEPVTDLVKLVKKAMQRTQFIDAAFVNGK